MATNDENNWELSKENIQPLKKGRRVSTLIAALDESKHTNLNTQKMEFEKQIRSYCGEDPLEVWYQYVLWVEQNYPKGGREGNSEKLIESCFNYINEKCPLDKYHNDHRFLDLWIKYADQCPDPLEIYNLLGSKGICLNFPALYENWSYQYEKCANYKKANEIYEMGLQQQGLEGREQLETFHKHFQLRVAKSTAQRIQDNQYYDEPVFDLRELGNVLRKKEVKKDVRAPIERIGNFVVGRSAKIQSDYQGNAAGPSFDICQGEDKSAVSKVSSGLRFTTNQEQSKEDIRAPAKWSKCKSRPKESLPITSLPDIKSLNFPVYSDPEANKDQGKTKTVVTRALSEKKAEVAWKVPFFEQQTDVKSKPMYCKSRVYCGTEEFSLEELRAIDYFQKLNGRNNDNVIATDRENYDSNVNAPLFVQEGLRDSPQYCKNKVYCDNEEFSFEEIRARKYFEDTKLKDEIDSLKNMIQKQQETIVTLMKEKSIQENISTNPIVEKPAERILPPARQILQSKPAYEDSWIAINTSVAEPNETNCLDESTKGLLMLAASETTFIPPEIKLETTGTIIATPFKSRERPFNTSLRDMHPSPTINTKLANCLLAECFNGTLSSSSNTRESKTGVEYPEIDAPAEPFEIYHDVQPTEPTSIPFTIFQDENIQSSVPFTIFQDENVQSTQKPKKKTARKALALLTHVPAELPPKEKSPIKVEEENKENEGLFENHEIKRKLSGILLPSQDIAIEDPVEELAVPLEKETVASFKPFIAEDFTIRLPSSSRDFVKMAPVASTPNPWSFGVVPQKNLDDDFTMKVPNIIVSKPQSTGGLRSIMENLTIDPPIITEDKVTSEPEFKIPQLPVSEESIKLSANGANNLVTNVSPRRDQSKILPKHSNLSGSKNIKKENEFCFDPDKVAAMLWDMDSVFEDEIQDSKIVSDQQNENELLSRKIDYPEVIDPFCNDLRSLLLCCLKETLESRAGYVAMNTTFPTVKPNLELTLGQEKYRVRFLRGKGNYAQIYQAFTTDPMNVTTFPASDNDIEQGSEMALKVQSPPSYWEFYICHELRMRMKKLNYNSNLIDAMMRVNRGYFFTKSSIIVTDYHSQGTLLDLTNGYKMSGNPIPQAVVFHFVIELLAALDALHSCGIIHGDLKPDNVLIQRIPSDCDFSTKALASDSPFMIKLIDFGRSIDLKLLPNGATFTKKVTTNGFTCCEMKDSRPWTYQTDYYGLAAIAHCLLWGSYMNVQKRGHKWMLTGVTIQRHWNKELWNDFFDQLLNVKSCHFLVDLKTLKERFISAFNTDFTLANITDKDIVIN